ncbi:MAG TPA: PKD domain-containing protein, partial [Vicinamibacterales bacterium]|nr:PKD domain-containing protein [Vicinamibacterales bacterium]
VGVPVNCTITTSTSGNASSSAPIQNVTVNWGDGSGEQPLGAVTGPQSVSHTYNSPGSFTVVAAATDFNSQRNTRQITLTVTRTLPTVNLSCPGSMVAGVPQNFTVSLPGNASPAIPIANVTVDFGDGTSRNLGALSGSQQFPKTYGAEGGYTVTATVTDTAGQRNTQTCGVIVTRSQPTVSITHDTTPANVNQPETFTVTATASSGGPPVTSVIVTRSDTGAEVYNSTTGGAFTVTFSSTGTVVLTARVTDAGGGVGQSTRTVNIQP